MIKFIAELLTGIFCISAYADEKVKIFDYNSMPTLAMSSNLNTVKILAHLDDEELAAIREACK